MAVFRTYSKGDRSFLDRFSGLVEGRISRLFRPIYVDVVRILVYFFQELLGFWVWYNGKFTVASKCFLLGDADASITLFPFSN